MGESCIIRILIVILISLLGAKGFRKLQEIIITVQLHFEIEYGFYFCGDPVVPVLAGYCTHRDTWAGSMHLDLHLNQYLSMK